MNKNEIVDEHMAEVWEEMAEDCPPCVMEDGGIYLAEGMILYSNGEMVDDS